MPTGYTNIIDDKVDVTFEQFLWRCARGMGAFVMMRDSRFDAPIPEQFEPGKYHLEKAAKAATELELAKHRTDSEWDTLAANRHEESLKHAEEYKANRNGLVARYEAIKQQVEAWQPPTPDHAGLKEFMLQQIETGKPFTGYDPSVVPNDGKQLKETEISKLQEDIKYHTREWEKEVDRTNARNEWIRQLRQSVPDPNSKFSNSKATA